MSTELGAIGCVVLYLSSALCSSAGVGGGTLNVPILINLFGFSYSTATILSLCTLMGNYLFQFLINLDKRHPFSPNKPLIYWDIIMILLPAEMGGANIGVILSAIMPDTILYILAVVVLIVAGALTLNKGLHLYESETLAFANNALSDPASRECKDGTDRTIITIASLHNDKPAMLADESTSLLPHRQHPAPLQRSRSGSKTVSLRSIIPPYLMCYLYKDHDNEEHDQAAPISTPWVIIQVILAVWFLYAVCYVVMHEFSTCSAGYYVVLGVIYPLLVVEVLWGMNYLKTEQADHPNSVAVGDVDWGRSGYVMPVVAFGVGILTTLLGIGGGELMGPLMLMFKVLPTVSSATTSIMSLLNSSSSILHYVILGQVPFGYAALVFGIGGAGGLTGRVAGLFVAQQYGRSSALVFALVAVLVVSFFIYVSYIFTEDVDVTIGSLCE